MCDREGHVCDVMGAVDEGGDEWDEGGDEGGHVCGGRWTKAGMGAVTARNTCRWAPGVCRGTSNPSPPAPCSYERVSCAITCSLFHQSYNTPIPGLKASLCTAALPQPCYRDLVE